MSRRFLAVGRPDVGKKIGQIFIESMLGNIFVVLVFTPVGNRGENSESHSIFPFDAYPSNATTNPNATFHWEISRLHNQELYS